MRSRLQARKEGKWRSPTEEPSLLNTEITEGDGKNLNPTPVPL
jgi:hypothetical protein